ncbi:MAG: DUF1570 domain-containing protein [Gemmataceae bacterium]
MRITDAARLRCLAGMLLAWALVIATADAADEWKYDVLRLKNGNILRGLVLEEGGDAVRFQCVRRSPGTPTVVITSTYPRSEVAAVIKLNAADRKVLQERIAKLDPSGKAEEAQMEDLELSEVDWVRKEAGSAYRYGSEYFVLVSNAQEDTVRRAAVRLEQIYTAYTRYLPPRHKKATPTTIVLASTRAEYQLLLKEQKRNILNPAFFDARNNQVVCASDLKELGEQLERVRKKHKALLEDLQKQELQARTKYQGAVLATVLQRIYEARRTILGYNKKNDQLFGEATQELFTTLYHESFHAYLMNIVYRSDEAEVPRWQNEGLAQIFETAIVEAGELRVGHVDKERLARVHEAARKGELLTIAQLLQSKPQDFLVAQTSEQQTSDRYYFNSWALAFYLTFDRKVLGTPELHKYMAARKRGTNELEAFRQLVGKPIPEFEQDYRKFLQTLRADGTAKN